MAHPWFRRPVGVLAGATLAALVSGLAGALGPGIDAMTFPAWVGDLLLAAAVAVVFLPLAPLLPAPARTPAFAFALGLGLGLVPLPAQLGLPPGGAGWALGAVLAGALLVAALRGRLPTPGPGAAVVLVLLGPAVAVPLAFRHDARLADSIRAEADASVTLPATPTLPNGRTPAPPPPGSPDVILVSVDTLRADAVDPELRPAEMELPFFDGLASSGASWPYALSPSNQTVPGHAGMLFGRDAMGIGVRWNRNLLQHRVVAPGVADLFRLGGYRTAGVISNPLLSAEFGFAEGFEVYDDTTVSRLSRIHEAARFLDGRSWLGLLPTRWVATLLEKTLYFSAKKAPRGLGGHGQLERAIVTREQAEELLDQLYAQERPFFLFVHFMDPHQPYGAPEPFRGRLTADLPPLAERYAPTAPKGMWGEHELVLVQRELSSDDPVVRAEAEAAAEYLHRVYLEEVMFLDAELARLRERVAASGRPTLWLVTSDHGEHFGEHRRMKHANTLYEPLLRVPFLLAGPGIAPGSRPSGVPHLADVAPTLLAHAGLEPLDTMPGKVLPNEDVSGRGHVAVDDDEVAGVSTAGR